MHTWAFVPEKQKLRPHTNLKWKITFVIVQHKSPASPSKQTVKEAVVCLRHTLLLMDKLQMYSHSRGMRRKASLKDHQVEDPGSP